MRRLHQLEMMAGMRRTRQERVAERQVARFRRQLAEREQAVVLIDKIRERELGAAGAPPMPFRREK